MSKFLKIFILLLILVIGHNADAKQRWLEISTKSKINKIIGGKSIHNYWIVDDHYTILNYLDGNCVSYPMNNLFSNKKIRNYTPVLIDDNRLIVLLIDLDWKTYIAEINDGIITQYDFVAPYPIKRVNKVGETLYATGDFGLILKLENNKQWINILSPIKSHIRVARVDKKGVLWLGTNGEGIFSWDGVRFTTYQKPLEIAKTSVSDIICKDDAVYFLTANNEDYQLIDSIARKIERKESPFSEGLRLISKGHYKITSQNKETRYISTTYNIKSFVELDDDHALLLTTKNQLLYDQEYTGNLFLDYTSLYGLEGPEFTFTSFALNTGSSASSYYNLLQPGIIFSDFNNDNYLDVLLFNVTDSRHPYLFLNNQDNYFTNFADLQGLNKLSFAGFFSYAFDLNGDNKPEIISPDYQDGIYTIKIYEKITGKYLPYFNYSIPKKFAIRPLSQINVTDIDNDGDLDLALIFGYSQSGEGDIQYLINNGYGNFKPFEDNSAELFIGWNTKAIFADFNMDGLDDLFVVRNWGSDVIYFKNPDGGWEQTNLNLPKYAYSQRKGDALAFDFDNDGDLDIFSLGENPFISVLKNDGQGNFSDITNDLNLGILNSGKKFGQFTAGDFDNNGYIDIFVSIKSESVFNNYIFLNDSSRRFVDKSDLLGISSESLEFAACGDIEMDGDLDIYGFKKGSNILWLNDLNSNNFLQIKLVGSKSNSEGLGAKIWVYKNGHLNDANYLIGYRQVGSMLTGSFHQNQNISHFGVDPKQKYDVLVHFKGGKTRVLKSIPGGSRVQINEVTRVLSWWYKWDKYAYVFMRNKEVQFYSLIFLFGLLILLISINIGKRIFKWDIPLINIVFSLNFISFILLLNILSSFETEIKYFIPLGVIILGSLGPLGFFYWIKSSLYLKTQPQKKLELFNSLLNFTHGGWALSNLNSLQLLFENLSVEEMSDEAYSKPFRMRKETFIKMTLPLIDQILSLLKNLINNKSKIEEIEKYKCDITLALKEDVNRLEVNKKHKTSVAIIKLRELITELKQNVFAEHSCNPDKVINQLNKELQQTLKNENVNLNIISFLSKGDVALIDTLDLTSVVDNCIQNSIKALKNEVEKGITIKLLKGDPRIFIEIIDNGCGIPEDKFQEIFENGYSTNNSSGFGLYYSKEALAKFGGRILLKESNAHLKTRFVIELQNGCKKEAN